MIRKVRSNSMIENFGPNWFLAFSHKFTKVGVIKLRISLQLTHNFRLICHKSHYLVTLLQKSTFTSNFSTVSHTFFKFECSWKLSFQEHLYVILYDSVYKATASAVAFWVWKSKLCPSYSNLCKLSKDSIWNSFEVIDFRVFKGLNLCFVLFIMCNIWESDLGLYYN